MFYALLGLQRSLYVSHILLKNHVLIWAGNSLAKAQPMQQFRHACSYQCQLKFWVLSNFDNNDEENIAARHQIHSKMCT